MTWLTVIMLFLLGLGRFLSSRTIEDKGAQVGAFVVGVLSWVCAYAMWERYL